MLRQIAVVALLSLAGSAACSKNAPDTPPATVPSGDRITGRERFGWDQTAADATELAGIRYAIYVDGQRVELSDVQCGPSPAAAGFPCNAPLPTLTAGSHNLELASFVVDEGRVLEGSRSAALRVTVGAAAVLARTLDAASLAVDGVALRLEWLIDGLHDPADLAFSADGRVFIAEANATIRVVRTPARAGSTQSVVGARDDGLLAVALDPAFAANHRVFVLLATRRASENSTFLLARFREQNGVLTDRVVILDGVPAALDPHGSLDFGPDGKLYVALDDGGIADRSADLSSRNGKLLRLNPDGSTPDDQAGLTPVFSYGFRAPHALTWQPSTGTAWLADDSALGEPLLYVIERETPRVRGRARAAYRLPAGDRPAAAVFYRGRAIAPFENNLFTASDSGEQLLRFTFAPDDPLKIVSTEALLTGQIGPIRVIAQGPDGSIYLANSTALARVIPAAR